MRNSELWELYGDNFAGYAVGFSTVSLARELNCSIRTVEYSDEPFEYSFLGRRPDSDQYLYKTRKWENESEFRFLTARIGQGVERLRTYSPESVAEVILGHNLPLQAEEEIMEILAAKYPSTVKVFKTMVGIDGKVNIIPVEIRIEK